MQTLNIIPKNYTINEKFYQLKLPVDLGYIIPENDCVRLLGQFVEGMDLSNIYSTYSRIRDNQASPRQMLKVLLFAYHEGIYSSRKIEKACRKNIDFMYLLEGKPAPDHTTIARFRTEHFAPFAESIMTQVTDLLKQMNEISGKEIFIDGTKIEAYANRYTFVWKNAVTKNQAKKLDNLAALAETCVNEYELTPVSGGKVHINDLVRILEKLRERAEVENISFASGKGKRKTQLQKHIESLEEGIAKLQEYQRHLDICGKRNSYSKTDHDATFMRMKEDHMQNGQLKPAYNVQFGVDSGYVTWIDVNNHPNDVHTLIDFLNSMHSNISFRYHTVVADAGYESEENYTYLEKERIEAMIKPANYESSKKRKHKNDIGAKENMRYNPDGDYYICRNGKKLYASGYYNSKLKSGYVRKVTVYQCYECLGCPYKNKCIKGNNWKIPEESRQKSLHISKKFEMYRKRTLKLITSHRGIQLRINRSIYSEGAFAELKEDRGFRRFLCRGRENVYAECVLMAISQNIAVLHRKIQNNRLQTHLYEVKAA